MYFEIHTGREKNLRYERGGIGAADLMGERGVQLANLATCVSYLSYMLYIRRIVTTLELHCNYTRITLKLHLKDLVDFYVESCISNPYLNSTRPTYPYNIIFLQGKKNHIFIQIPY